MVRSTVTRRHIRVSGQRLDCLERKFKTVCGSVPILVPEENGVRIRVRVLLRAWGEELRRVMLVLGWLRQPLLWVLRVVAVLLASLLLLPLLKLPLLVIRVMPLRRRRVRPPLF